MNKLSLWILFTSTTAVRLLYARKHNALVFIYLVIFSQGLTPAPKHEFLQPVLVLHLGSELRIDSLQIEGNVRVLDGEADAGQISPLDIVTKTLPANMILNHKIGYERDLLYPGSWCLDFFVFDFFFILDHALGNPIECHSRIYKNDTLILIYREKLDTHEI